jgi:hypothetical protein
VEAKRLAGRPVLAEASLKENNKTIAKYRKKVSETAAATPDLRVTKKMASLFLKRDVVPLREIPVLIDTSLDDKKGMANIIDSMNFLVECGLIEENMNEGRWIAERRNKLRETGRNRRLE